MVINRPVTKTTISTAGWGIPVTDQVNANTDGLTIVRTVVRKEITLNAIDATTNTFSVAATLDFGTTTYKRIIVATMHSHCTAINASMIGSAGIGLNGTVKYIHQGANIVQNAQESIMLSATFDIPANTAAVITAQLMNGTQTGAYRVVADGRFSYIAGVAFPY